MRPDEQIEMAYNELKDFQKKTVDHAIQQYLSGQRRFMVADEVGLGKTITAKGIIAKLVQHNYNTKKLFHVVYICSNQTLAKQNLSKLSFVKKENEKDKDADNVINYNEEDDRITALAYEEPIKLNKYGLRIRALTPGTSFDNKTNAGKADERVLLYRILASFEEFHQRRIALKWFLQGGKSPDKWDSLIQQTDLIAKNNSSAIRPIRKEVYNQYYKELKKVLPLTKYKRLYQKYNIQKESSLLNFLLTVIEPNKQNRSFVDIDKDGRYTKRIDATFKNTHYTLIAELRFRLSLTCKDFLNADLYVLDEFQRYSNLIEIANESDDPGTFIAKSIFSKKNARILMLSATPFKPYTTSYEEMNGENHYVEFMRVLGFLLFDREQDFWDQLNKECNLFFRLIRTLNDSEFDQIRDLKESIEEKYRQCIARTERTLVEEPTEASFDDSVQLLQINKDDIVDFIKTDEIIKKLNEYRSNKLPVPVEYVKSSPFPLSFLQDYEHMKALEEELRTNSELSRVAKKAHRAWISKERVLSYKALLPESDARKDNEPNAKLRLLYDETVRNKGWQLLWVPPSVSY